MAEKSDHIVAKAKKMVGNPYHDIELSELIRSEVEEVVSSIKAAPHALAGNGSEAESARFHENAVETLARIFGVVGRWGSDSDLKSAIGGIEDIENCDACSNFVVDISLSKYPSIICVYNLSLGLLARDEFSAVREIFRRQVPTIYTKSKLAPFVLDRFLDAWDNLDRDFWQKAHGSRLYAPLSEHLFDIIGNWYNDFGPSKSGFENQFDLVELIGSMSYLECNYTIDDIESIYGNLVKSRSKTPTGRVMNNSNAIRSMQARLEEGVVREEFKEAGFFSGMGMLLKAERILLRSIQMGRRD